MHRLKIAIVTLTLVLVLGGCATKSYRTAQHVDLVNPNRILLMPVDVELSLLTAGGVEEPNAQWTAQAKRHIASSLGDIVADNNARVVQYGGRVDAGRVSGKHAQIIKLHSAVGLAILRHKYMQGRALPTKEDKFDWTLGTSVTALGTRYKADHALFIFLRDSYASSGRTAAIIAGSLIGANIQGGRQAGFASLVDLRSGEIVWFNVLARQHGDLRTPPAARETVAALLEGFPQ